MEIQHPPARDAAARLLRSVDLPTDDLDVLALDDFLGCGTGQDLSGLVGLETGDGVALLRSLAVAPSSRGTGLGRELVARAEALAQKRGANAVYLLTETAEPFFRRLGYRHLEREQAPDFIRNTSEFKNICPAGAAFMVKDLTRG